MRKLFFIGVEMVTITVLAFWLVKDIKNGDKGIKGGKRDPLDLKGFGRFAGNLLTEGISAAVRDVK